MRAEFGEGLAVAVGWGGEAGVADGGAVASHVDRVHDREGAADTEGKAEEEADDCRPVEGHYDGSLSRLVRGSRESVCGDLSRLVVVGMSVGAVGVALGQDVSGVVGREVPGLVTMFKGCMVRRSFRIMRRILLWGCCSNAGEICDR